MESFSAHILLLFKQQSLGIINEMARTHSHTMNLDG